jgi:iron complex outermembrane receptor protein
MEQIADAGQGLGFVLARLAPGMGPETQSVSNFGQQLQGRKVLVLIDGIPQNENRQISRQLNTVQVSSVERIEIIAGATAIYGADAMGGAINIITRRFAESPLQQHTRISASASDKASFDQGGASLLEHSVSGTSGSSQYFANASYEKRASTFDAHGDLIPPEPAQTSRDQVTALDALVKYAYRLADDKRVELAFNYYRDTQDLDYTVGIKPYRAMPGLKLEDQPASERRQLSLRYEQGGFSALAYQKNRSYRFFPFVLTSPFPMISQSTSESDAWGARLQWDLRTSSELRWIYGLDYENEDGLQKARAYDYAEHASSNGTVYRPEGAFYDYGPDVQTTKLAPFLQSKWSLNEKSNLHAGLRHEFVRQRISDFTPPLETAIESNYALIRRNVDQLEQAGRLPAGTSALLPTVYQKAQFEGGQKSLDATAVNLGYSFNPDAMQQFYLNYAQGYELADTARLMRDAVAQGSILPLIASALQLNVKTTNVDDVEVATIQTQSLNAGYKNWSRLGQQSLNLFFNQSDRVYRFNRDFTVDLLNQKQQVYGFDAAIDVRWPRLVLGGSYAMGWGRVRQEQSWLRLSTVEVNPPKLTLYAAYDVTERGMLRFQSTQLFSQRGSARADVERFRGYSVEDLHGLYRWNADSSLRLGVSNLFNRDYKTVFHQWAGATYGASSGTPASGRRLSVGYEIIF